jgi:asparagine synthase (glutamine-hydrolysing)
MFCIGFEAGEFDETQQAAAAAKALGTEHSNVTFTGHTMEEYPKTLYCREEPTADATFSALYYLFQACRQENLKVVLSGEGADELLGGYAWHRSDHWVHPFLGLPRFMRTVLAAALSRRTRGEGGKRLAQAMRGGSLSIHRRYRDYLRIGHPAMTSEVISPEIRSASGGDGARSILESWKDHLRPVAEQPEFDQMLWLQSRTRMVDWVNHSVDHLRTFTERQCRTYIRVSTVF